jgi:HupE / UreJ protein
MIRSAFCLIAVLGLRIATAGAHPVAQGSMEITIESDYLHLVATVSAEEAFVADALGDKANATTLDAVWQRHGTYLLDHLIVEADGQRLTGKVESFAVATVTEHVKYDLRYPLPSSDKGSHSIALKQNVLNEFTFAPGNPWEATYIVKIPQARPRQEGALFTSREPLTFRLGPQETTSESAGSNSEIFFAFLRHGIRHILSGYDHLLFVAGLVLAVVTIRDLVKVVTAFTLAHTITLTLAVLDVVRVSNRIVEPMIAASIVFVAFQNLIAPRQARGNLRLAIAFAFGLFHGLGFAGGLLSAMEGMQTTVVATAIVAFSMGVEIGHQVVALPLFGAIKMMQRYASSSNRSRARYLWISRVGSGAIGIAGTVYLVAALLWVR